MRICARRDLYDGKHNTYSRAPDLPSLLVTMLMFGVKKAIKKYLVDVHTAFLNEKEIHKKYYRFRVRMKLNQAVYCLADFLITTWIA